MTMIEKAKALVTEVTAVLQGARSAQAQIETTTRDAREKHARIRETVEAKLRARDEARDALPPDGELDAHVRRLVGAYAQAWLNDHGLGVLLQLAGQLSRLELNGRTSTRMGHPALPLAPSEPLPFGLQAALDPEGMTARWIALIRAVPHQSGSPMAQRPAVLEQLDRELVELETLEDQLAIDLGVPRRPEMVQRERDAERARQLEAERLKNRRHTEEALKRTPTYHTANFMPGKPSPSSDAGRE
jgi:hypothetical protein